MSYFEWTTDGNCNRKDPINLEFNSTLLHDIRLYLEHKNWRHPWFACTQFLPNKVNQKDKRAEDESLILGNEFNRYHMRLWNVDKKIIVANIHYDSWTVFKGHVATEYEVAEKKIAAEFGTNGFNIELDAIDLGNYVHSPLNNGRATRIGR